MLSIIALSTRSCPFMATEWSIVIAFHCPDHFQGDHTIYSIGSTGWLHGFLCLFNFSNQINSSMGLFKKIFFVHYLPQNLELFYSYRILFSTLYITLVLESEYLSKFTFLRGPLVNQFRQKLMTPDIFGRWE